VDQVSAALWTVAPAVAFLCAGVPLAALLDRLGFFDAVVAAIVARRRTVPLLYLWVLCAGTTVVLNLDTTIVLLTPLAVRLARRAGRDPLPVALVPLLLASLASSSLPVSNLTTLIVAEGQELSVGSVVAHMALPTAAAVVVGWLAYRRRHPGRLELGAADPPDGRALRIGGAVVAALLIGFVFGPEVGIDPWVVALTADVALVAVTRHLPWRAVPVATAVGVLALAVVVALIAPDDVMSVAEGAGTGPAALGVLLGVAVASVVNNLPAALLLADGGTLAEGWGGWGWLLGVNVGAVLSPIGALANLLWWRILRAEGVPVTLRRYVASVWPVAVPALLAAAAVLALTAAVG
jgi:arsenical pump membrane protein